MFASASEFDPVYYGHDGVRTFWRTWFSAWEKASFEYEEFIDAGDNVVTILSQHVRGRASGIELDWKSYGQIRLRPGRLALRIESDTSPMAVDVLTWEDSERLRVGETVFHTLAPDKVMHRASPEDGEFAVFKARSLIETYAALIAEHQPERILELGIATGGSTVLLAELARPAKLVAIDRKPLDEVRARVGAHADSRGFSEVIRTFGGVDQADRSQIARIVEEEFGGHTPDLVIDDCSHLYEPTRASFNELFPRLRPGGAYLIEDWTWAHNPLDSEYPEGVWPDEVPLTRLFFEIELAIPSIPGLIASISIDRQAAVITRGEAEIDPQDFEIASCANRRGRSLLAPP